MDSEIPGMPQEIRLRELSPQQSFLRKVFLNPWGLRAGWRLLMYIAIVAGLSFGANSAVRHLAGPWRGVPTLPRFFMEEIAGFAVVFGAALISSRIERRSAGVYGLPARETFGKLFWQGWLLGLAEVSALLGLIAAFGGYSFGGLALHGSELVRWALIWAVFFVVVGFYEEFMFRGYTQYTLADGIGFWPAAIVLSVLFGAVHLRNPGEGLVGAASVVEVGLFLALTLRRTGNLWFAVGLHASFDFGETFLFSVPNSGMVTHGHLSNATLHGAKWLTGGTVGPEGSVFSFLTIGLLGLVVMALFPAKQTTGSTPSPQPSAD
jgi:membrane protease YdiL (CAAX protease family)